MYVADSRSNEGLGSRLNGAIARCIEHGLDWIERFYTKAHASQTDRPQASAATNVERAFSGWQPKLSCHR
jgi:hypothetical protein